MSNVKTKLFWALDPRFQYTFCFGMETYKNLCKKNQLFEAIDIGEDANAAVVPYPGINLLIVVYLRPVKKRLSNEDINTMVHEATHVVDNIFEWAGEKKPGKEARAYMTAAVVQNFMEEYQKL